MNEVPSPSDPGSINFHLHTLASSLFKGATSYYVASFGVGLPEMRVLSNLGREGTLAAHQLVARTAMDKALVSRVLAVLVRRAYIAASKQEADPRRRAWELTPSGRDLVSRLQPVWREREAIIQADLTAGERVQLVDMLRRMFAASEKLRAQETRALSARRSKPRGRVASPSKADAALVD